MPFSFEKPAIRGLLIIRPDRFEDNRGWFMESYKHSAFSKAGIPDTFVQDNYSLSTKGVVRGLHFQVPPYAQGKLVSVVRGKVWDVAVDLRVESATYRQWYGVELSEENQTLFYIPPGFAHGFCALADDTRFLYKCTAEYHAPSERGIKFDDPDIGISWPVQNMIVSERDAALPSFASYEKGRGS
jgi:dTDP-4-dehydrorhamnose 3,5-epimerase